MTRETKIGLLVGLAFIVVFAMLLSHSGPTPPPGDVRQLAQARQSSAPPINPEPSPDIASLPVDTTSEVSSSFTTESSSHPPVVEPPAPTMESPEALPTPTILEPGAIPGTEQSPNAITDATLQGTRIPPVPMVNDPIPSTRTETPTESPPPVEVADRSSESSADPATPETTQPSVEIASTAGPQRDAREHVVQKGDTVDRILRTEYADAYTSSYSKLKELFLKANKSQIKDEHMVITGQTLVLPKLPAGMFEPVGTTPPMALDVGAKKAGGLIRIDNMINDLPRRKAPSEPVKLADKPREKDTRERDSDKSKDKGGDRTVADARKSKEPSSRDYEVQSKDTFTSIAREQCGSTAYWQEIKRLNPGVDPGKLRPGMKLKLPAKRLLSDAMAVGKSRRR